MMAAQHASYTDGDIADLLYPDSRISCLREEVMYRGFLSGGGGGLPTRAGGDFGQGFIELYQNTNL